MRFYRFFRNIALVLTFVASGASFAEIPISSTELTQAIQSRLSRTPEFEFIRKEAEKLGVRVWLFGGTAAAHGHYVKWDLQREKGDTRFQKDRFDYDYTNIYRSTQDLDVVIDGTPEQAQQLQKALAQTYPHFLGSKTQWEVRLLKSQMGTKEALLDNPDFLNQNTDSNSVGMIELTKPPKGESVVRDLRAWTSADPPFLQDLRDGELHYYFSPKHAGTSRAKAGLNPPILSVIRYLTKAFQYDLEIRPEDEPILRKIIDEFDPKSDLKTAYVKSWIEKNGKKLFQNAVNLDRAESVLDRLGLRSKLIGIHGDVQTQESMAWWLNRKALKDRPLGTDGKTAAEIFMENGWPADLTVSHETRSFLAYESITRAHTGEPNVFVSRTGFVGEVAAHGEGFYARVGREGAVGSGKTIRFKLDPKARLGADFELNGDYLIIKNKRALRVIPESLNWEVADYFRFLLNDKKLDHSDLALLEKLRRTIQGKLSSLPEEKYPELVGLVSKHIKKNGSVPDELFYTWAKLPLSPKYLPEIVQARIDSGAYAVPLAREVYSLAHWKNRPEAERIRQDAAYAESEYRAAGKGPEGRAKILARLRSGLASGPLERREQGLMYFLDPAQFWVTSSRAFGHGVDLKTQPEDVEIFRAYPRLLNSVLESLKKSSELFYAVSTKVELREVLKEGYGQLVRNVFAQPGWHAHRELIQEFVANAAMFAPVEITQQLLSRQEWVDDFELKKLVVSQLDPAQFSDVLAPLLADSSQEQYRELMDLALDRMSVTEAQKNEGFTERLTVRLARGDEVLVRQLLREDRRAEPELMQKFLRSFSESSQYQLNLEGYSLLHPWNELVEEVGGSKKWSQHPKLFGQLIAKVPGAQLGKVFTQVLNMPGHESRPDRLYALLGALLAWDGGLTVDKNACSLKECVSFINQLVEVLENTPEYRDPEGKLADWIAKWRKASLKDDWYSSPPAYIIRESLIDLMSVIREQSRWRNHPAITDIVSRFLSGRSTPKEFAYVIDHPEFPNRADWIDSVLSAEVFHLREVIERIARRMSSPPLSESTEWVERALGEGTPGRLEVEMISRRADATEHPEWIETILNKHFEYTRFHNSDRIRPLIDFYFSNPKSVQRPEVLRQLLQRHQLSEAWIVLKQILTYPAWSELPQLKRLANGQKLTVEHLVKAFKQGDDFLTASASPCAATAIGNLNQLAR